MNVLVIDDEPLIRRSLEKIFVRSGHEVTLAEDGEKGVLAWDQAAPDIVVLDVLMPGLTGPEVIEKAANTSGAGIILISAYTGEYNLESARQLGADLFIAKPFDDIRSVVSAAETLFAKKDSGEKE